ncbi:MAG: DUF5320 domain-containing protein [Eubacteriales bacterium]|nr:DUF5320 domain-containing protein [Eubacteriales bacterium]MDD3289904.1 DUF5320 domain-containing protein [Eubacteriales bacterium]
MPGRDGTGPLGQGAMTGRGLGVCTGANVGFFGAGRGCGMGLGGGYGRGMRGFGMRRGYCATGYPITTAAPAQKDVLNEQKAILENQLEAIRKQLDGLSEDSK